VPAVYAAIDPRGVVRVSTRCRDATAAAVIAERINADLERFWAAGIQSGQDDHSGGFAAHQAAIARAAAIGLTYRPLDELVDDPTALAERLLALRRTGLHRSRDAVAAGLGTIPPPSLRLSSLLETYEANAGEDLIGKSQDQIRKWRNVRRRAIANLVALIGDRELSEIDRAAALEFRRWWLARIEDEGLDIGTANKDIGTLNALINGVDAKHQLGLGAPFAGLRLRGEQHNPRVAYEPAFVEGRILAPGALDGLNPDARAIVYLVAALGLRPSEAATLQRSTIHLDADIPHIEIAPPGRRLKTAAAARTMPLVGLALRVLRRHPDGFPRYRDHTDVFSATANKSLRAADLRPTPEHTVYSLRHTFQDLLTAAEVPPRVDHDLMGHALGRVKYGTGSTLAQKRAWLERVAYRVAPDFPA
jgi:integrase